MSRIFRILCCAILPISLCADGGVLQFRRTIGPLTITLFSAPTPLRAGRADLSVLLQAVEGESAVLDAQVEVRLQGEGRAAIHVPATHEAATNRLLYAAAVTIPEAGNWHVAVNVTWQKVHEFASGELVVLPKRSSLASYWLYLALAPLGVLLFVLHQYLKIKRVRRT